MAPELTGRGERAFWGTATALAVSFLISFVVGPGPDVMPPEMEQRLVGQVVVWPQEWAFFSGLDEDTLAAYRIGRDGGGAARFEIVRSAGSGRFDRSRDELVAEVRRIARVVPDRYWQRCSAPVTGACGRTVDTGLVYGTANPSRHPHLCGTVAIAVERTEPAGFGRVPDGRSAHRVAVVQLRCPG